MASSSRRRLDLMDWPVVSSPGPDCEHPQRFCVAPRESCPHALSWLVGSHGYHRTRCGRDTDGEPMAPSEIGRILGVSRQHVDMIVARAVDKLRDVVPASWRGWERTETCSSQFEIE